MVDSSRWENAATEPILQLLDESDLALSHTAIVYNLSKRMQRPPSKATVTRALKELRKRSLVHQPHGTLYEITEDGREYLEDDAEKLEE